MEGAILKNQAIPGLQTWFHCMDGICLTLRDFRPPEQVIAAGRNHGRAPIWLGEIC